MQPHWVKTMSPCHSEPSTRFVNDISKVREANAYESGNLVYAINTKSCNMSYIGETGSKVADRYREYLIDILKEASKTALLHFRYQPLRIFVSWH